MPVDLQAVFHDAIEMIDDQRIDGDIDFDHRDLLREVSDLITHALGNLHGLSDDPMHNDEILRAAMTSVALKAFIAGHLAGQATLPSSPSDEGGIVIRCQPGELEAIGIALIRDGVGTFHLVTDHEPAENDQDVQG